MEREFVGVTGKLPPVVGRSNGREFSYYVSAKDRKFRLLIDDEDLRQQPRNSIIPVDIAFAGMDTFHFQGQIIVGQVRILLDDDIIAQWTHDFTAGTVMTVSLPTVATAPWTFDLTGTTPTIGSMATAVKAAGITGLPRPWANDGSQNAGAAQAPVTVPYVLPSALPAAIPYTITGPVVSGDAQRQLDAARAELDRARGEIERVKAQAAATQAAAARTNPQAEIEAERLRLQIATQEATKADADAKRVRAEADRAQAQAQLDYEDKRRVEAAARVEAQRIAEEKRAQAAQQQAEADAKGVAP